jgi:membrane protease YdiL (CAAX protease family)
MEAALMLLFFEGSQGMTLLRLPRLIFPAVVLSNNAWIGVYEGHIWELAFALAFIRLVGKGRYSSWGINLRNAALSWQILWKFTVVFALITLAWTVIPSLLHPNSDLGIFGPPTLTNVVGWLSFEWIFVGFAEEIMFRGVIHTNLAQSWKGVMRIFGFEIPTSGIVTTVLFCLAHIDPLHPHIYWSQQLFAFGLGIYYSMVFHRTGSLLNPILAHNVTDGMIVTAIYLIYWKFH